MSTTKSLATCTVNVHQRQQTHDVYMHINKLKYSSVADPGFLVGGGGGGGGVGECCTVHVNGLCSGQAENKVSFLGGGGGEDMSPLCSLYSSAKYISSFLSQVF